MDNALDIIAKIEEGKEIDDDSILTILNKMNSSRKITSSNISSINSSLSSSSNVEKLNNPDLLLKAYAMVLTVDEFDLMTVDEKYDMLDKIYKILTNDKSTREKTAALMDEDIGVNFTIYNNENNNENIIYQMIDSVVDNSQIIEKTKESVNLSKQADKELEETGLSDVFSILGDIGLTKKGEEKFFTALKNALTDLDTSININDFVDEFVKDNEINENDGAIVKIKAALKAITPDQNGNSITIDNISAAIKAYYFLSKATNFSSMSDEMKKTKLIAFISIINDSTKTSEDKFNAITRTDRNKISVNSSDEAIIKVVLEKKSLTFAVNALTKGINFVKTKYEKSDEEIKKEQERILKRMNRYANSSYSGYSGYYGASGYYGSSGYSGYSNSYSYGRSNFFI